ncbi:MAG: hypothetical protein PWP43_675 [Bacillota bacterium]|nr:hypothetical protein [Bacillota bacterium]
MQKRFSALLALLLVLALSLAVQAQPATVTLPAAGGTGYDQVYSQVHAQLQRHLGYLLSPATIADLARRLSEQVVARLGGGTGTPPEPQPAPAPQPVPKPQPVPEPQPAPAPEPAPALRTGLTVDEARMVELVNQERAKAGLKPLAVDMRLVETARAKSRDLIEENYFGHISPKLGSPFEQMQRAGISYRYAGENLAGAPTVDRAHAALMKSPGHRANILSPHFTRIGVGIVDGGPYGKMFTQQFVG